jgi:hypothetical protein
MDYERESWDKKKDDRLKFLRRAKGRDHWEDLGAGGRITLRWTLGR